MPCDSCGTLPRAAYPPAGSDPEVGPIGIPDLGGSDKIRWDRDAEERRARLGALHIVEDLGAYPHVWSHRALIKAAMLGVRAICDDDVNVVRREQLQEL